MEEKRKNQKFEVLFFDETANNPEKFLRSLTAPTIAKALRILDLLTSYGPIIGMPYVKKVDLELYELRIRGQEEVRFLFSCQERKIIILHGFKKKQDKIPRREMEIALKRSRP